MWEVRGTYLHLRRAMETIVPCAQGRIGGLWPSEMRRLGTGSAWGVAREEGPMGTQEKLLHVMKWIWRTRLSMELW